MKKILIIYGPRGGYTEHVADTLKMELSKKFDAKSLPGTMVSLSTFNEYDNIIIGVATLGNDSWNAGRQDMDVNQIQVLLHRFDVARTKVALIARGNSMLYPEHVCDDMDIIEDILQKKNAEIIGYTSTYDYSFKESKALRDNQLCGLALDNDTENEKTEARISAWIDAVTIEFLK